jgi:hypothetical protein
MTRGRGMGGKELRKSQKSDILNFVTIFKAGEIDIAVVT